MGKFQQKKKYGTTDKTSLWRGYDTPNEISVLFKSLMLQNYLSFFFFYSYKSIYTKADEIPLK